MNRRQVGGYEWNAEIARIRTAANDILQSLQNMLEGTLGPQTILAHAAKMIGNIGTILNALNSLETFGEKAKTERTNK
jgi:hypothetical protein